MDRPLDDHARFCDHAMKEGYAQVMIEHDEFVWCEPVDPFDEKCDIFRLVEDALYSPLVAGDLVKTKKPEDPRCDFPVMVRVLTGHKEGLTQEVA